MNIQSHRSLVAFALGAIAWATFPGQHAAALPDATAGIDDSVFLRFHGQGDVLRTAAPFDVSNAFPGGGQAADQGSALHARIRVRLAPQAEYDLLDDTNNGSPTPGRVLWDQGLIDQNSYGGMTIAYRHDTHDLYFVVSDSGPTNSQGDERKRVWRVNKEIDDATFRTIDWSYDESTGDATCWIDGVQETTTAVFIGGAVGPAPLLNGTWGVGGAIMGSLRSSGMYTLAGRGWGGVIGGRDSIWPNANGPSSSVFHLMDENTSTLGDVSFAGFRWAPGTDDLVTSPWEVELRLDNSADALIPTDSAGGLDSQLLLSPEHNSVTPSWVDTASLPNATAGIDDSVYLRFHGRGDVLRTAAPFNGSTAFPGSGHSTDPGDALHARLRVRLAPQSEYDILDQTNAGSATPGRVLWNQSIVDLNTYAGMAIAYRHDTQELYFVVSDSGPTSSSGDERTRMWRVKTPLDDGAFRTIDWSYEESTGDATCWINGESQLATAVILGTTPDPAPALNGIWSGGGSIMSSLRSCAMYTLAGRGWGDAIGARHTVWPELHNTPLSPNLDENISTLGDVAYAAFRWAPAPEDLLTSPWEVELRIDNTADALVPTDSAGGLDSQLLISADPAHDTITPSWVDAVAGQHITDWAPGDLPTPEDMQTRQLMIYHHGLGDQTIKVTEKKLISSVYTPSELDRSLVLCMGPDGEIVYWAIKTIAGIKYSVVGPAPVSGVHSVALPQGKPGVYRLVVKSTRNESYAFETDQEALYWGAYAPFSHLRNVDGLPSTGAHAYVPADSELYDLRFDNVTNATEIAADGTTTPLAESWELNATFGVNTKLLSMDLGTNWSIEARRFPLVLCNSRYAAEHYIRAGVIETPNFTLWSPDDKVLRDRIVEIASTGLGSHTNIIEDFSAQESHIVNNYRTYFSLGDYPVATRSIHTALEYQVTNTTSAMVGSIDHEPLGASGYLRYADKPNSIYNFDQFGASMMFWAGWDDSQANPYFGDADFAKRARCAMLAYARHIQGTRIRQNTADNSMHHGSLGLAGTGTLGVGLHWGRVYGLLDADDRKALLPAMVLQLVHILNVNPTTTRNQDSEFLPFLYEAGRLWASENQHLANPNMVLDIAEEYARRIVEPQAPWAGQDVAMQEASGFDGSYSGIMNHLIATGWIVSGGEFDPASTDPNYGREWTFLADALNRQYGFWSHYMTPSAASSPPRTAFGHDLGSRTVMGAIGEQYSGAKMIGSHASDMVARLALEDGGWRAGTLLNPPTTGSTLDSHFPVNTAQISSQWVVNNKPGARDGAKFDLMPLYIGGADHLFDSSGPIDFGARFPCEASVASGTIEVTQINEAYIAVNTPCYYAIIATRKPGSFYYSKAFNMYKEQRAIEDHASASGGGPIKDQNYPDGTASHQGEEIGGVGLSLFYDKTSSTAAPVIAGRNWTPLTTHQLIGYTAVDEHRRWAEQGSRVFTQDLSAMPLQATITVDYELNHATGFSPYIVEREFTFHPDRIDVSVTLSEPATTPFESMDRFVENIPFELAEAILGTTARNARLTSLEAETLPWTGTNTVWDTWCATNWTQYDGLQRGNEIGWLQKNIPAPTGGVPSVFTYSINPESCGTSAPLMMGPGQGMNYTVLLDFIHAVQTSDPSADIDGDGQITPLDVEALFNE